MSIDVKGGQFYKSTWPFCHTIVIVHTPSGYMRLSVDPQAPYLSLMSDKSGDWFYTKERLSTLLEKNHWTLCEPWEIRPPVGFKYEPYDVG